MILRAYMLWLALMAGVKKRLTVTTATGNTTSNLGWLAISILLIIGAYVFWTAGPGHTWYSDVLQAPTSVTP
jgi:hypothetical protein